MKTSFSQQQRGGTLLGLIIGALIGLGGALAVVPSVKRPEGVGAAELTVPGLGSQIFDEVADRHGGSWSLERTSGGTTFCMRVATSVPVG
jgi:hypothetical protein